MKTTLYLCDFIDPEMEYGDVELFRCWCQAYTSAVIPCVVVCECRCHLDRNPRGKK